MLFLLVVFFAGFFCLYGSVFLNKVDRLLVFKVCSDLRLCNEVLDLRDFHIVLLCEFLVLFLNGLIGNFRGSQAPAIFSSASLSLLLLGLRSELLL